MALKDLDIVYFVKESPTNEELRYSVRSVAIIMIWGGSQTEDVKVFDKTQEPGDGTFLSSEDGSFVAGSKIVALLQEKFPDKCKYEVRDGYNYRSKKNRENALRANLL